MIIQYFKKGKHQIKKGVMVALPIEEKGVVRLGYSLCHFPLDNFKKERGIDIAVDRALCDRPLNVPDSMKKIFTEFKIRCKKYYKQLDLIEV